MKKFFASVLFLIALALPAKACDYGASAFSYGYAAPVVSAYSVAPALSYGVYAPQALVAPFYAAPALYGYAAPVTYGYSAPVTYGYSAPFAVSSYSSYGLGVSRVRVVSPFAVRSRLRIVVH